MNISLNPPPLFNGDLRQQVDQVTRYLFQLQRDLSAALDSMNGEENPVIVKMAENAAKNVSSDTISKAAKSLKSLIIKTAHTIQEEMDTWAAEFEGSYLALSDFGTYREELSHEIEVTATNIVSSFNYSSIISALQAQVNDLEAENTQLKTYKVETEQYTKSGLLYYDEDDVPVYGYAVGEVLTRVIVNGEETVRREDLMATWSAGRLNFWQGGRIVAYYANNKMYVTDGEFLNSLQIGDWIITTTGGNLDIDFAGEE